MAVNHLKFCVCIQGSLCKNSMVDGSGNVLEYLDGRLNNVQELMRGRQNFHGDVLLKHFHYGLLVVVQNIIAAAIIS